ncbi:uncharacterized protein Z520_03974 [Fonsecaea multimorphosa CBS 102226]|uniref:Uncharacterized protein n=1 Tax=Fonsecaea multimorphosa CBS 102226 TaxID=1442371 RepID=A0A0D2KU61_9EURO|nr:uncharacterized protein Z520_03974 [Fonsecaea multimorphosa CBS 102226]KIY00289.1 hypothetical protein Z520_03974 [Fonsecaea multimorphosa CBS 102226]OAL27122.1 hypothetical protein AYO22_03753 [Fonsecaea multimorphosa]
MSRLGGRDLIPIRPGGWVYGPVGGGFYGDDDDELYPLPPRRPPVVIRQPTIRQPVPIRTTSRDIPLPDGYPYPLTRTPQPTQFPEPPRGSAQHKQTMKFTPWILNLTAETHKCADLNLFRLPRPEPPRGGSHSVVVRQGQRQQGPESRRRQRGTVVLPIMPGPKRRIEFDVSVMTLSDVLYNPGAPYSELSWKLLERQSFTRHVLHHDHMHDVTHLHAQQQPRRPRPPPTAMEIGWRGVRRVDDPRPSRSRYPTHDPRGPKPNDRCGHLDKETSVIRHRGIPGVDILWVGYDKYMDPRHMRVHMTAADMVDVKLWSWGVEMGVVGKSAELQGFVDWIEGPSGNGSAEDEDLFRKIVQGGLRAGEDLGVV